MTENRLASTRTLIVIPCLNEAEHLEGLVEGLLPAAARLNGAILIVDGGSTDGTREIAARLVKANAPILPSTIPGESRAQRSILPSPNTEHRLIT